MTATDFVYLGLIVLAAMTAYVYGFHAGAEQTRQDLRRFRQQLNSNLPTGTPPPEPVPEPRPQPASSLPKLGLRRSGPGPTLEGDFSGN